MTQPSAARVGLFALFLACAKIGVTSFGGSVSAMMHVEFVTARRWVTETEFMSGIALAQALPGVNVTNLSLWLGYRLRGPAGAVIACLGSIVPAGMLIISGGAAITHLGQWPVVGMILAGVAAAAMGLALHMALRAARHAMVDRVAALVLLATFVGGMLHVPLMTLAACTAPLSIAFAYLKIRREA